MTRFSFFASSIALAAGLTAVDSSAQSFSVPAAAFGRLPRITLAKSAIPAAVAGDLIPSLENVTAELHTQRFQHRVGGIEVLGSQALRHTRLSPVQGMLGLGDQAQWTDQLAKFDLDLTPRVSESDALGVALQETPTQQPSVEPRLLIIPNARAHAARLVYRFEIAGQGEIAGRIVDVDAHTGRLVASVSRHWEIAPIDVYTTNTRCQTLSPVTDDLGGSAPISVEYKKCLKVIKAGVAQPSADEMAIQAFTNSQLVLNYYWNGHRRDSFDNQGSALVNVVHVGDKWTNAFWDSENDIMAYGDGDGVKFRNLTLSLDVAGHEMTHGVVSKTANLEYQGESGALNEGLADFFGETIEGQKDWVMGRDLFTDPSEGKNGLRNLFDPSKTKYRWYDDQGDPIRKSAPAHYSEIFQFGDEPCGPMNDNCGVHMNATLVGHAGYLMVQAIGPEKAGKVMYSALVHYLTETSDFAAFAKAAREACAQLYGSSGAECTALDGVMVKVGL